MAEIRVLKNGQKGPFKMRLTQKESFELLKRDSILQLIGWVVFRMLLGGYKR